MDSELSVTEWLDRLKQGDSLAAQRLWERYFERLLRIARRKLGERHRRVADEEDVVLQVFDSAIRAIQDNCFAKLNDRDDLWQVLVMLTERKAIDERRRSQAAIRGGGAVRGDSALGELRTSNLHQAGWDQFADNHPTPEFAALMAESLGRLLKALEDDEMRKIALDRLSGFSNSEIAQRTGTSLRTVERRVGIIRQRWEECIATEK